MLDRGKYAAGCLCNRDPDNSVLAQHSGQNVFESNFRKPITRDVYFGEEALLYRKKTRLPLFFDLLEGDAAGAGQRCGRAGDREAALILRAEVDLSSNPRTR